MLVNAANNKVRDLQVDNVDVLILASVVAASSVQSWKCFALGSAGCHLHADMDLGNIEMNPSQTAETSLYVYAFKGIPACILLTGTDAGCGSSAESHAPG